MELQKLKEWWGEKTKSFDETSEFDYLFLDIFPKLCRKAQEMICDALNMDIRFFTSSWNYEELPSLTPIEQIYLVAFSTYSQVNWIENEFSYMIRPQKVINNNGNKYRVDFFISDFFAKTGIMTKLKTLRLKRPIIIECDGYDYHSTRQQKNSDTERENELKMLGYPVIRFTGSQIYKDPYLCVLQTIKFIYDENKEQIDELIDLIEQEKKNVKSKE